LRVHDLNVNTCHDDRDSSGQQRERVKHTGRGSGHALIVSRVAAFGAASWPLEAT
jgi:hypothetical protein